MVKINQLRCSKEFCPFARRKQQSVNTYKIRIMTSAGCDLKEIFMKCGTKGFQLDVDVWSEEKKDYERHSWKVYAQTILRIKEAFNDEWPFHDDIEMKCSWDQYWRTEYKYLNQPTDIPDKDKTSDIVL